MGWTDHCVLKGGIKRGGLTIVYFRGVLNGMDRPLCTLGRY